MNIKKAIGIALGVAVLSSGIVIPNVSAQDVTVRLDGNEIKSDKAEINNGSTMVPMRAIFEAFGMNVDWNNDEKKITATKGEETVLLTVGEKIITVNDKEVELSVAPYIKDGTTLVPVRAVAEGLNAKVSWNNYTKSVDIVTDLYDTSSDKWKENEGKIDLSTMTHEADGVQIFDNVVVVTKGGDFTVTGENTNAMIYVNSIEKVKLRLENVKLTNNSGPAIFFDNCEEALITISKGSENFLADGEEYSVDAKATIFANDDIEIKGAGVLNVTSKGHHAIASDDDIKIEEGTLVLTADKKDGIHANNTIKIKGGNINVTAYGDGIQSEEDIVIEDGTINVKTTGEVANSNNGWGGEPFGGRGNKGNRNWENMQNKTFPQGTERPEGEMMPPEGGFAPPEGMERPEGMMPPEGFTPPEGIMPPDGLTPMEETEIEDETVATKGIKAETDITIEGGEIEVNAADHAIHSAGTINIKGGKMNLTSQKGKGISAHGDVVIDDGVINVLKASEGLESKANFTINGGEIDITASDDGINAGGTSGRDVASRQNVNLETGHDLVINGGKIVVNAQGDGLDANGRMIIKGGEIVVEGPTNNGNGALDSGGVILTEGGTLIALGASGMAETPSNESSQPSFRLVTESSIPSNSLIEISDASGKVIYSYKTVKTGNSVVFSSKELKKDETYTVTIGEAKHEITLTGTVTNVGNGGGFGGFGGGNRRW